MFGYSLHNGLNGALANHNNAMSCSPCSPCVCQIKSEETASPDLVAQGTVLNCLSVVVGMQEYLVLGALKNRKQKTNSVNRICSLRNLSLRETSTHALAVGTDSCCCSSSARVLRLHLEACPRCTLERRERHSMTISRQDLEYLFCLSGADIDEY